MNKIFTADELNNMQDMAPEDIAENKAWEKEANAWAALYLIYDNNIKSMKTIFHTQGFANLSSEEVRLECLSTAKHLITTGYDWKADKELDDELKPYFEKIESNM